MTTSKSKLRSFYTVTLLILFAIFSGVLLWGGCGGGGEQTLYEGSGETSGGESSGTWERIALTRIDAGGMLNPRVQAEWDSNGQVHVLYFTDSNDPAHDYSINYLVWDSRGLLYRTGDDQGTVIDTEPVVDIDNCMALAFSLDKEGIPVVAYRGGRIRNCGQEQQSDAMLIIRGNSGWEEYTGAIGVVERNPFFGDGLAGTEVSVILDSKGDIHLCYQFFYEGCDAMNYQYPDLCYVKRTRSALDDEVIEETVEGNQYGSLNIQNHVGDHCVIALDDEENPVIFYYAAIPGGDKGLRVARKMNGTWKKEWIEKGCEVGGITCARWDEIGYLGVAYYVEQYTNGRDDRHCLRYAEVLPSGWKIEDSEEESSSWDVRMVDDSAWCGKYCSLAFDFWGFPAIAYYEIRPHSGSTLDLLNNNLKIARFDGESWKKEVVAFQGDIGLYNSLWFDPNDRIFICSFSNTQKEIDIFYR
ncbi:MAG: hypothetical protein ACMUIM_07090 [bacterium]